ncbi:MAG: NAD-dependent epimerase [Archangium gephyra]|uniref:NAD-dependent epimerase n=1 Tax=Archangium gephyra TaxID=48 RepID=A0A2W5TFT6_9BACT|nr:MAG: NAD-dependent epimerase [Archangium gephyra]
MNILITGGTGFLGTHLVPLLRSQGHTLTLISRSKPPAAWLTGDDAVRHVQADLKDREAVRSALKGIDALYHLAGLVSFKNEDGRKMYELHVDCTRELLRDVRSLGTKPRVILASTSGTIAVSKTERVGTEADDYPIETVGRWPYYLSKIYEEKLALEFCKKEGIPLVILNPSLLMGPGDDRLSSTWTVVKFLQRDIPAMPGGGMSFADARDVAQAALNALTQGELYGRHLMGVNLSMHDFFKRLERMTGVPAPRVKLPKNVNIVGAYALERFAKWRGEKPTIDPQEVEVGEHWFWLDSAKAEAQLGYSARDPYETLHDTVDYVMKKLPPGELPGTRGRLAELLK